VTAERDLPKPLTTADPAVVHPEVVLVSMHPDVI
jgi:hypothetical protein